MLNRNSRKPGGFRASVPFKKYLIIFLKANIPGFIPLNACLPPPRRRKLCIFSNVFPWLKIFWGNPGSQGKLSLGSSTSQFLDNMAQEFSHLAMTLSKATDYISRSLWSQHKTIFSLCLKEGRTKHLATPGIQHLLRG